MKARNNCNKTSLILNSNHLATKSFLIAFCTCCSNFIHWCTRPPRSICTSEFLIYVVFCFYTPIYNCSFGHVVLHLPRAHPFTQFVQISLKSPLHHPPSSQFHPIMYCQPFWAGYIWFLHPDPTVAQRQGPGFDSRLGSLPVRSLHVLPVSTWVSSGCSSFLPQSERRAC